MTVQEIYLLYNLGDLADNKSDTIQFEKILIRFDSLAVAS